MRAHRRPLVTAAVAGGLLCGLWFVPSANATGDGEPAAAASRAQAGAQVQTQAQTQTGSGGEVLLADTGSFDTTPYLVGGLGFLGAGAALLVSARVRAGREGLTPAAR
ncbi:hypothetical protein [Streptomyces radiopugnans]|uniref:LPXTG-motif cell wall anchor domain-containing protein n=1 Tax=Streptomyces radiopugnans TaxID=403935 RepID=A0A1H9HZX2_9ACTN|nr:hypothetical protein [Streptomyces radiopugnans]SEQ67848.1 hypothetical protein SAMN05216481_112140 [Streptomyces radiopugnans]